MSNKFSLAKTLVKTGIIGISLGILLNGCMAGMGPRSEELRKKNYSLYKDKNKISLSKAKVLLKNGTVELANGDTILDEDGDIVFATEINNQIFYIVKNYDTKKVSLKNANGKTIKNFGKSFRSRFWKNNNKIYIATTTQTDSKIYTNVYSNVYEFDGEKVKLKLKNKVISGKLVGATSINWSYSRDGSRISRYYFYDIFSGKNKIVKPSLVPNGGYTFLGGKMGYEYKSILGKVGNTIVYIYKYKYLENKDIKEKLILEAQNLQTGKIAILLDNSKEKFSFLTNGEDVVFKNKNRIIDIRTLKSATIDKNFIPIVVKDMPIIVRSGDEWRSYNDYTISRIIYARDKKVIRFLNN